MDNCTTRIRSNYSVYLTRHGARIDDSEWLKRCQHNRNEDPHLSRSGHIGALELARRLKETPPESHIKHIVSSPYIRCVETSNAIAEELKLQIKIEPGIAEVNTSRSPQFLDAEQLQQQFPLIDVSFEPVMSRHDLTVEYSDAACANRSAIVARTVRAQLTGGIIFVGHGASCLGIASAFGHRGYVGYTSLTKFVQLDGGKYRLDGKFGDVNHLTDQKSALDM